MERTKHFLYDCFLAPQDAIVLSLFRVFWGGLMVWEMYLYSANNYSKLITLYGGEMALQYQGWEWLEKPTLQMMMRLVDLAWWSAVFMTIGFCYNLFAMWFLLVFGYMFFIDQSTYLNHFYLLMVIQFIMVISPANAMLSVDCILSPKTWFKRSVERWHTRLIVVLLSIVYLFAAIVKLNEDWLRGEPLRHWVCHKEYNGFWLAQMIFNNWWSPYALSYGGIFVDYSLAFLMYADGWLYVVAWIICLSFHALNKYSMNIGIFPYMCIVCMCLTFSAKTVRRIVRTEDDETMEQTTRKIATEYSPQKQWTWGQKIKIACILLFLLFHILFPLRFILRIDANQQSWMNSGHDFSWRMKLKGKMCHGAFFSQFPGEEEQLIKPIHPKFLSHRQYNKLLQRPEAIQNFAQQWADKMQKDDKQHRRPEIHTNVTCSVNYRMFQLICPRNLDLANKSLSQYQEDWMYPLMPLSEHHKQQYPWNWDWVAIYNKTINMDEMAYSWWYLHEM